MGGATLARAFSASKRGWSDAANSPAETVAIAGIRVPSTASDRGRRQRRNGPCAVRPPAVRIPEAVHAMGAALRLRITAVDELRSRIEGIIEFNTNQTVEIFGRVCVDRIDDPFVRIHGRLAQ